MSRLPRSGLIRVGAFAATLAPALGLLLAAIALCGCAASPPPPEGFSSIATDAPPGDFTLAVTVYAPAAGRAPRAGAAQAARAQASAPFASGPSSPRTPPVYRRPARYVIETDARLRVALGPGCGEHVFPPPVRDLDDAHRAALWQQLRALGLLADAHPARVGGLAATGPEPDALEGFTLDAPAPPASSAPTPPASAADAPRPTGPRTVIALSANGQRRWLVLPPADPAARALVSQLAQLAWLTN